MLILFTNATFFILTYLHLFDQSLALRLLTIALRMSCTTRYDAQFYYKIIMPNPISKDFLMN